MKIERGATGHAYRYVPTVKINTLYGAETVNLIRCKCCGLVKNESSYYHAKGIPFKLCIECDDKRRLRDAKIKRKKDKGIHIDKNLQPIPNLEELA